MPTATHADTAHDEIEVAEPLYGTGTVLKATGIALPTLNRWVQQQFVRPVNACEGKGHHLAFSTQDVVAIAVGLWFRRKGFDAGWCGAATRLIADLTPDELHEQYTAGKRWVAPGCFVNGTYFAGALVEAPKDMVTAAAELVARFDLIAILNDTERRLAKLSRKLKGKKSKRGK